VSVSNPDWTDEQMVALVRTGDEAAAQELFTRHLPRLRVRLRRRMAPGLRLKSDESDVIQEAYMTAYLRLADFQDRGEGSFARWLSGIVDNKLREEIRRHFGAEKRDVRREQRTEGANGPGKATSGQGTPSGVAMANEETLLLVRAINGLPEDYRTVLHLLYEQGLPLKDAGERMNRSPDAVRMLYGRALAALGASMRRRDGCSPR